MVLDISKDTRERRKKKKNELSTPIGRLKDKIKNEEKSIRSRKKISTKGGFGDSTKRKEKKLEKLKLELKKLQARNISDRGGDFDKPLNKKTKTEGRDFEKSLKTKKSPDYSPRAGKSRKSSGSVTPINTKTPKAGPAELGSQRPTKEKNTTIDKSAGRDSREDQIGVRIARMLGDKRSVSQMIRDREESDAMEEEMNYRKGGAVSKKYGMRAGGFTKRGGLYKKGY
jgi:hypothetical protein